LIVTSGAPVGRAPGPACADDLGGDVAAQRADVEARRLRGPLERGLGADDLGDRASVGEEAGHRSAAVRRERLAHGDERLGLVDLATAEREREADQ
jgi:hypothetical protein